MKPTTVRIPRRFYDDHNERDLPSPAATANGPRHYLIPLWGDETDELLDDARHYADASAIDLEPSLIGLRSSARATLRAIERARGHSQDPQLTHQG